jgi:ribosomal protein S18 acetylase RimI-like enzyme
LHNRIPSQTSYRLIVAVENHEARRFYKRHGFHEETRLDNAYFPGVALPREDVPSVPVLILRKTTS